MAFRKVLSVAEMGDRDCVSVPLEGGAIALFRAGDQLYAMQDRCSHARWPLSKGAYRDGVVECMLHKAKFCVRTGAALSLPATKPVPVYPLKVVEGDIYVDLPDPAGPDKTQET